MNVRERMLNCLRYKPYGAMPVIHFGFWGETLQKWAEEGHITADEANKWGDGNEFDFSIGRKLGFDSNWSACVGISGGLHPCFETKTLEELPDGSRKVMNGDGVVILQSPDAGSIPAEIEHTLVDRASWERHYLPRLRYEAARLPKVDKIPPPEKRETPLGIHCGSYFGMLRNWVGVIGAAYIQADDEKLFDEMIDTTCELSYRLVEETLATGVKFDFAHMWEDICFKNGPLIAPDVFAAKIGPHYKKLTTLLARHGIDLVSLDCDGKIDALLPIWFENGVNTMFPIEVGTWRASIEPWRRQYGKGLRGVGGMDKVVFAQDAKAINAEIERLKPLVALGGFIPCPDHRLPPDAKWDNVRYYCDRMRKTFAG